MALPVSIPLVTKEDLITFHKHAFGTAPPPHSLPHFPTSPGQYNPNETHASPTQSSAEDDEELGYYPDGKKRTLTDEQVAMFRHSEIYSIVRARQVKRENEDADANFNDSPPNAGVESDESIPALQIPEIEPPSVDENCATACTQDDANEDGGDAASKAVHHQQQDSRQKRRKLNKQRSREAGHDTLPSRRVIRELDAAVEVNEPELDY